MLFTQNLDWIYEIKEKDKLGMVGFYSDFFTSDWVFPLLESWFIATTANNKFISNWADEFERCYISEVLIVILIEKKRTLVSTKTR